MWQIMSSKMIMKMGVRIISREIIKPSLPTLHHLKPFKLPLFDQITPTTYGPLILFYPTLSTDAHFKNTHVSTQLKRSLSESLTHFYPLSGRVKDNFFIDCYHEGVTYIETRVNSLTSDFYQHPQLELLNQFLPCQPFVYQPDPEAFALMAVQVNIFDCGGIAIGVCMSHKITDGSTMRVFLNGWAASTRGSYNKVEHADLLEASLRFPPHKSLQPNYLSFMENLWFNGCLERVALVLVTELLYRPNKCKTKVRQKVNVWTIQLASAFIWKSAMAASNLISDSPRPSLSSHAVNIRRRAQPHLPDNTVGNLFWWAMAYSSAEKQTGFHGLVNLMKEAISNVSSNYLKTLQGNEGNLVICEFLSQLAELYSKQKPEVFGFTSLPNFGFDEIDFGLGKPIWVGILGEVSPTIQNLTIFKETGSNNAVEAWLSSNDKIMALLENDPEFLAFASSNAGILNP